MRKLSQEEELQAIGWMKEAIGVAKKATCERSRCGSIVVKHGKIIGVGYNSPVHEDESQRRCLADKGELHRKVTDKTCCVHAEQRAIMEALRSHPGEIVGSTLYFIRLDESGEKSFAGRPYCTICCKMALDTGISEFVLWHEDGIVAYETGEYNLLSYQYTENDI